MTTTCHTSPLSPGCPAVSKITHHERAEAEFAKLLAAVESRGFWGNASLTVAVQDGAIQNIKVSVEKLVR